MRSKYFPRCYQKASNQNISIKMIYLYFLHILKIYYSEEREDFGNKNVSEKFQDCRELIIANADICADCVPGTHSMF